MRLVPDMHLFGIILARSECFLQKFFSTEKEVMMLLISGMSYASEEGVCTMSESVFVAVPSNAPAGLDAVPSAHFGHCDAYTVACIRDGLIQDVSIEYNEGHEQGGCIVPVQALADKGVRVLLAGGMGMGPLNAMHQMGIQVFYAAGFRSVREALQAYIDGRLQAFGSGDLCRGGCGHHRG